MSVFAVGTDVYYARHFLDDVAALPGEIQDRVADMVAKVRDHGIYYPGVQGEKVQGQADNRFHFLRVNLQYRAVAVVEYGEALLLKVGNHDETEKWGEAAQVLLSDFAEKVSSADVEIGGRGRKRAAAVDQPMLLEAETSLHELVTSPVLGELITVADDGVLEGWADGTIEDWMIFLSPVQRRAVDRAINGPARVTGGPGTGKSVVALHRAADIARDLQPGQKVLVTSFVRTVPEVMQGLFERLAPDVADRVEFRTVHSIALGILDGAGPHPEIDRTGEQTRARFHRLFENAWPGYAGATDAMPRLDEGYLWDEVTRVIGGRQLADLDAYLALNRVGRRKRLWAGARRAVWRLHQDYLAACANPQEPVMSYDQALSQALVVVRDAPTAAKYAAIVIDEAQDITEIGLRFLVELLEGGTAGRILVVGDAGQRIYAGGWSLADLGLEVRGRSFSLAVCYRSTDEIMRAVGALGQFLSTEEFGDDGLRSLLTTTVRSGPRPELCQALSPEEEIGWILDQLDPDDPEMDGTAILVYGNSAVRSWLERLGEAGLGAVPLTEYHGRPKPGVKVGTYHRAKGLEFARVFLPGLNHRFPYGDKYNDDNLVVMGSALYVGMSRARDVLKISYAGRPSMFLEPVIAHCAVVDPQPAASP